MTESIQNVTDVYDLDRKQDNYTVLKPFSTHLVKGVMPEEVVKGLDNYFEEIRSMESIPDDIDNQYNLAGNLHKEFYITAKGLKDTSDAFVQMISDISGQFYLAHLNMAFLRLKDIITPLHKEILERHLDDIQLSVTLKDAWGNISIAGDQNPIHHHTGHLSGVGYLRVPEDIEEEWLLEDHDPSSGMIQFWDGRPAPFAPHYHKAKPMPGDLFIFPAWLPHSVHPFRSKGERWSFSFNVDVENRNIDLALTDLEKQELKNERRRLLKELKNEE